VTSEDFYALIAQKLGFTSHDPAVMNLDN